MNGSRPPTGLWITSGPYGLVTFGTAAAKPPIFSRNRIVMPASFGLRVFCLARAV
ncbi:MAG: hypothetical protein AAF317_21465 [Pseudomonadota bacterium]